MNRILILFVFLCFGLKDIRSQEYVRLMENPNTNFYSIQKAFYDYWDGKSYEKGKGWKQFKRWEYIMQPRVYPSGRIHNPGLVYEEHLKFKKKYASPKGKLNNKNSNWQPIGPYDYTNVASWSPGLGRINAITVDPNNDNIIYAGSPAGGCWKSTDAGSTWTPLTDNLASLGVSGIAIDPFNSDIIYIATGDGDNNDTYSIGVMKSIDGGQTWNKTGLNWATTQFKTMRKIIIHPSNSNILWVASSDGLWKTSDAGSSWTKTLSGSMRDIELNPANPNTIFACSDGGFFRSYNGGDAFVQISSGLPSSGVGRYSLAVTADDTSYLYLLAVEAVDNGFLGLYQSTNSGNSFNLRTSTPNILGWKISGDDTGGQGFYDLALAASPTNKNEIYSGGVNIWKSNNGGASFSLLTHWAVPRGGNLPASGHGYVHADIHSLDFYGSTLFCGSDGGIYKSTDKGTNWSNLTFGIQNTQFYKLGTSPSNTSTIIAGAQDNGCLMLKNGNWTSVNGADGMECIVDYTDDNISYVSSQNGVIRKSTDGGNSFHNISNDIPGDGAWVTPYALDPINHNTIYIGYHDIWKSTNAGSSWNKISAFTGSPENKLNSLVPAPSNNNYIYAATENIIYRTMDGGNTWTNITAGLPNNAITYISVHNLDPNTLWVSFSGFGAGRKVYKTTDGGANWINISGNLPNIPINCIVYEEGTNNGTYIGTDVGVYYKNDDLAIWQSFMEGLPNVMVTELEIHYPSGKIRAASFGRGLWESDLFIDNNPPIVKFSTPDTTICPGTCANFTNETSNLGLQWQWHFPGGTPSTSKELNPTICYQNDGNYDVFLTSTNKNGTDTAYVQNQVSVQIPQTGIPSPVKENFETTTGIPAAWSIINDDNGVTWTVSSTVGGSNFSGSSVYIDNYSSFFIGKKDYLVTPHIDFSNSQSPVLTFDIAYSQFSAAERSDTLAIYYSTDCGLTKTLLWEKAGLSLATTNNPTKLFVPTSNDWKNRTVDLSPIAGLPAVDLYIENRSGFGNALYLDNINILSEPVIGNQGTFQVSLYPNPVTNMLTVKSDNHHIKQVRIYDVMGKVVFSQLSNQTSNKYNINLSNLGSGVYLIKVFSNNEVITKNIVKH